MLSLRLAQNSTERCGPQTRRKAESLSSFDGVLKEFRKSSGEAKASSPPTQSKKLRLNLLPDIDYEDESMKSELYRYALFCVTCPAKSLSLSLLRKLTDDDFELLRKAFKIQYFEHTQILESSKILHKTLPSLLYTLRELILTDSHPSYTPDNFPMSTYDRWKQLQVLEINKILLPMMETPFTGTLFIKVANAWKLPPSDLRGMACNPLVEISLVGRSSFNLQTQAIQKTLEPIWNEEFEIIVPSLEDVVHLKVFHKGEFNRLTLIGNAYLPVKLLSEGTILDVELQLTRRGHLEVPVSRGDTLDIYLGRTKLLDSFATDPVEEKTPSNWLERLRTNTKTEKDVVKELGFLSIRVQLHSQTNEAKLLPTESLPDAFGLFDSYTHRLFNYAVQIDGNWKVKMPAELSTLLDEFCFRYCIGPFYRSLSRFASYVDDFLYRTADASGDVREIASLLQYGLSIYSGCNSNDTTADHYEIISDCYTEALKQKSNYPTTSELQRFDFIVKELSDRLASLLFNITIAFPGKVAAQTLPCLIKLLRSLGDLKGSQDLVKDIIQEGIKWRYAESSRMLQENVGQVSVLINRTWFVLGEIKSIRGFYGNLLDKEIGVQTFESFAANSLYHSLTLDLNDYFQSIPKSTSQVIDLYVALQEMHEYILPLRILGNVRPINMRMYFQRFIDEEAVKISTELFKSMKMALEKDKVFTMTETTFCSPGCKEILDSCLTALNFALRLKTNGAAYLQLLSSVVSVMGDYIKNVYQLLVRKHSHPEKHNASDQAFVDRRPVASWPPSHAHSADPKHSFHIYKESCCYFNNIYFCINKLQDLIQARTSLDIGQEEKEFVETEVSRIKETQFDEIASILVEAQNVFVGPLIPVIYYHLDMILEHPASSGYSMLDRSKPLLQQLSAHLESISEHILEFSKSLLPVIYQHIMMGFEEMINQGVLGRKVAANYAEACILNEVLPVIERFFMANKTGLQKSIMDEASKRITELISLYNRAPTELILQYKSEQYTELITRCDILIAISRRTTDQASKAFLEEHPFISDRFSTLRYDLSLPQTEKVVQCFSALDSSGFLGYFCISENNVSFHRISIPKNPRPFRATYFEIKEIKKSKHFGIADYALKVILKSGKQTYFHGFSQCRSSAEAYEVLCTQSAKVGVVLDSAYQKAPEKSEGKTRRMSLWQWKDELEETQATTSHLQKLFNLDADDQLLSSSPCNYFFHGYWREGVLYLFSRNICFYSHKLIHTLAKTIALKGVTSITKLDPLAFGIIQASGIQVVVKRDGQDREYAWRGLQDRDNMYRMLLKAWKPSSQDPEGQIMSEVEDKVARELQTLFNFPQKEKLIDKYGCSNKNYMHGFLYVTTGHVCFCSSLLQASKFVLHISSIRSVRKVKHLMVDSAIEIVDEAGINLVYHGFIHRDEAVNAIHSRMLALGMKFDLEEQEDDSSRSQKYRDKFDVDSEDDDELITRYLSSCDTTSGYLWVGRNRLCYSSKFSGNLKVVINYSDMKAVRKAVSNLVATQDGSDSIEVNLHDGKKYTFTQVSNPESAFDEIEDCMKSHGTTNESSAMTGEQENVFIQQKFELEEDDTFIISYSCTYKSTNTPGYLYVTTKSLCFDSEMVSGGASMFVLSLKEVQSVDELPARGKMDNIISITTVTGQVHILHGFNDVSEVHRFIMAQLERSRT